MFRQDDGSYNVAWRRPQRKRTLPGMASEGEDTLPPLNATGGEPEQAGSTTGGDGLGESTAPSPKTKAKAKETADA